MEVTMLDQKRDDQSDFMRPTQVAEYLTISRTTLYSWLKTQPDFPRRIRLTNRVVGWWRADVECWVESRRHGPRAAPRRGDREDGGMEIQDWPPGAAHAVRDTG